MSMIKFSGLNVKLLGNVLQVMSLLSSYNNIVAMLKWWEEGFMVKGRFRYNNPAENEVVHLEIGLTVNAESLDNFDCIGGSYGCTINDIVELQILLGAIKEGDDVTFSYEEDAHPKSIQVKYERLDDQTGVEMIITTHLTIHGNYNEKDYELKDIDKKIGKSVEIPPTAFAEVLERATGLETINMQIRNGVDVAFIKKPTNFVRVRYLELEECKNNLEIKAIKHKGLDPYLVHLLYSELGECKINLEDPSDTEIKHKGLELDPWLQIFLGKIKEIVDGFKFVELPQCGIAVYCTIPGLGCIKFFTLEEN